MRVWLCLTVLNINYVQVAHNFQRLFWLNWKGQRVQNEKWPVSSLTSMNINQAKKPFRAKSSEGETNSKETELLYDPAIGKMDPCGS